jgi:catechol 2,3-dioxygenase-like lactoylglutathione lyase family enzyme
MITGVHAIIYSDKAEAVRAFLRDVLEYRFVDAGGGWPIFALPPAEIAVHPAEGGGKHELYLMCDDLDGTLATLRANGVEPDGPVHEERWGRVTSIRIAEGTSIGIYQPKHPLAISVHPS